MGFHQLIGFEIHSLSVESFPFHQLKGQIQGKLAGETCYMATRSYFFPDLNFSQPNLSRLVFKDA
jgi:hypothetical protein